MYSATCAGHGRDPRNTVTILKDAHLLYNTVASMFFLPWELILELLKRAVVGREKQRALSQRPGKILAFSLA